MTVKKILLVFLLILIVFSSALAGNGKEILNEQLKYKKLFISIVGVSSLFDIKPSYLTAIALKESLLNPYALHVNMPRSYYYRHKKLFRGYKCSRSRKKKRVFCSILPKSKREALKILKRIKNNKKILYDIGIMQVNKRKIKEFGIPPEEFLDMQINFWYAAKILKKCLIISNNDFNKALNCYHMGERKINLTKFSKYNQIILAISDYFSDLIDFNRKK